MIQKHGENIVKKELFVGFHSTLKKTLQNTLKNVVTIQTFLKID